MYFASTRPPSIQPCCLKNACARPLPLKLINFNWSWFQLSKVVDLTKLMCTPRLRCVAEQSRHISIPKVTDAQVGFLELQSKHILFSDLVLIFRNNTSRSNTSSDPMSTRNPPQISSPSISPRQKSSMPYLTQYSPAPPHSGFRNSIERMQAEIQPAH